jgi:hypothetical protein
MSTHLAVEEVLLVMSSILLVIGANLVDRYREPLERRLRLRRRS